ncbi:MAG: Uma2 family endonuclease [Thermoguttaceae bacterium]
MTMLIENPELEEELKEQRKAWGVDQHDEVWEGVYFTPPMANDDHQDLVLEFATVLRTAVSKPGLGKVRHGVNFAASMEGWEHDYRVPDVVVFLADTAAENHDAFWTGAADFIIEITSLHDRTYEKTPFYSRIGVRELLILNRQSWAIELYRHQHGGLHKVGHSTLERPEVIFSEKVLLEFWLMPGEQRPQVEVRHRSTGERWVV